MQLDISDGCAEVPDLGVHLGGHHRSFDEALALVQRAETLGYRAAYVDGDVSVVPSRGDAPVLEGWTATVAMLARTSRIEIGSIRIARQWNAARLAQAVATAEVIAPNRLRFLISIGAQPADRRFGFPMPPPADRIAWLDELLDALRRLWAGESVTLAGRFVTLDAAIVRPLPRGGRLPIDGRWRGRSTARRRRAPRRSLGSERSAGGGPDSRGDAAAGEPPAPRSVATPARSAARSGSSPGPVRSPEDPALAAEFRRWQPGFARSARRRSRRGDPRGSARDLPEPDRRAAKRSRHRPAGPGPRGSHATRSRNRPRIHGRRLIPLRST